MKHYLQTLRKHLNGLPQSRVEEIVEEIRMHLLDEKHGFELKGYSEREAGEKACASLGDPKLLAYRLKKVHRKFFHTPQRVIIAMAVMLFVTEFYFLTPRAGGFFLEHIVRDNELGTPYIPTAVAILMTAIDFSNKIIIAVLGGIRLYHLTLAKRQLSNTLIIAGGTAWLINILTPTLPILMDLPDLITSPNGNQIIGVLSLGILTQSIATFITMILPFLIISTYAHYRKKDTAVA